MAAISLVNSFSLNLIWDSFHKYFLCSNSPWTLCGPRGHSREPQEALPSGSCTDQSCGGGEGGVTRIKKVCPGEGNLIPGKWGKEEARKHQRLPFPKRSGILCAPRTCCFWRIAVKLRLESLYRLPEPVQSWRLRAASLDAQGWITANSLPSLHNGFFSLLKFDIMIL